MNRLFTLTMLGCLYLLVSSPANALRPSFARLPVIMIIDHQLSPRASSPHEVKQANGEYHFPNKSKVIGYYLQLNRTLAKKNPIKDAKQSYDSGQYFFLSETFDSNLPVPALVKYQKHFPAYKKYAELFPKTSFKIIQGGESLDTWYHRTSGRDSKVLILYGQSVVRYAYYWNRTMNHYLNLSK